MTAVIFLGPSLPLERARRLLPDAAILPPARQADLISAVMNRNPDVIGLIDGEFLQKQAVWHKEILFALERGVAVYGASSMGALRAAETTSFGMIGIGEIFRRFADRRLCDDDEVALLHGPAEDGYPALSHPMVNLRATLEQAVEDGVLEDALAGEYLTVAKSLYFPDRVLPKIREKAVLRGCDAGAIARVEALLSDRYVDLKARDAEELLAAVARHDTQATRTTAGRSRKHFAASSGMATLYNRERTVGHEDTDVCLADIAEHIALHDPHFEDLNFDALNRHLVGVLARLVGASVDETEVAQERSHFRSRHGLDTDADLERWQKSNHLAPEEFDELIAARALCRAMHRWLVVSRFTERTTRIVLDEVRLRGTYPSWVGRAAGQERLLAPEARAVDDLSGADLSTLQGRHEFWTGWQPPEPSADWWEWAGFASVADLRRALAKAVIARESLAQRIGSMLEVSTAEPTS